MSTPLKIFISSTYSDLQGYRESALSAMASLDNTSEDYIDWPMQPETSVKMCFSKIIESDVMLLIIAHSYGKISPGFNISYTEAEYDYAKSKGIPILAFIIDISYPWRLDNVDFENRSLLDQFKNKVVREQEFKSFTTPESLTHLINKSLEPFLTINKISTQKFDQGISLLRVLYSSDLYSVPDMHTVIGDSLEGLPLVLHVQRSKELELMFSTLESKKPNFTKSFPRELLKQMQSEFIEPTRIRTVHMKDGSKKSMYVSRNNLSNLSYNILIRVLAAAKNRRKSSQSLNKKIDSSFEYISESTNIQSPPLNYQRHPVAEDFDGLESIESVGGMNRFLGISIKNGDVFSVGIRNNQWVEWRPYLTESLVSEFAGSTFSIYGKTRFDGTFSDFSNIINNYAFSNTKKME